MTRLIALSDLPEGAARCVRLPGIEPIAVFHVEGRYYATQDTCSHAQASLAEGWLEGHEIACPVHDARFDLATGRALSFPATEAIQTFPTRVEAGALWADLGAAKRT